MAIIDKNVVKKVSEIARLNLSEKEVERFSVDLENILAAFKELRKVNTEGVEPTFQPLDVKDVLREDKKQDSLGKKTALENAQQNKEDGYFKGPKVV